MDIRNGDIGRTIKKIELEPVADPAAEPEPVIEPVAVPAAEPVPA